jgi:hypothetical protein
VARHCKLCGDPITGAGTAKYCPKAACQAERKRLITSHAPSATSSDQAAWILAMT